MHPEPDAHQAEKSPILYSLELDRMRFAICGGGDDEARQSAWRSLSSAVIVRWNATLAANNFRNHFPTVSTYGEVRKEFGQLFFIEPPSAISSYGLGFKMTL